jgi:hypothetical protein
VELVGVTYSAQYMLNVKNGLKLLSALCMILDLDNKGVKEHRHTRHMEMECFYLGKVMQDHVICLI